MRGHHDRGAVFGGVAHQCLRDFASRDGVEIGEWFVEQKHLGASTERKGQGDASAVARRQRLDPSGCGDAGSVDELGRIGVVPVVVGAASEAEHFPDCEARVQRFVLCQVRQARRDAALADLISQHRNLSGVRGKQSDDERHQRRLACAVGSDKSCDAASFDVEGAVFENLVASE
ncbi:hypothetical protein BJF84_11335 [Rhodococcus sp. CUA-806]|nr:hypothetical protein BJF84_11335 [Rhodococcus sp. CUA-806]